MFVTIGILVTICTVSCQSGALTAIVSAFGLLAAVMGDKIALMAVMRLDVQA